MKTILWVISSYMSGGYYNYSSGTIQVLEENVYATIDFLNASLESGSKVKVKVL